MRFLGYLGKQNQIVLWSLVVILLVGLGVIDYYTGPELAISLFYLLPISLASWALGKNPGRLSALLSALIWQSSNLLAGERVSGPLVVLWNTLARLGIFLVVSSLISEIHMLLDQQMAMSRTDSLTGLLNQSAFYEAAGLEMEKAARYQRALTVVFMDLDNFKEINDTRGHVTGDALLQRVATRLKRQLRGTDFVGRLGGDEYAILLPEMNASAARTVIPRLQQELLKETVESNLPVTFSLGVLTCLAVPPSSRDMIHRADQLMYGAKRQGKNSIVYGRYPDEETSGGEEAA
jgi:diguanylate cyclase (GGDEF)-like protein